MARLRSLARCTSAIFALICFAAPVCVAGDAIHLVEQGGIYRVPALINGMMVKLFILDSGASDVQVPAEVFLSLFPETVSPADFLPGQSYMLANGTTVQSRRFLLHSIRLGDREIRNVPASISDPTTPLLLGQAVLKRIGRWSIDNDRGILVLGGSVSEPTNAVPPQQPILPLPQTTVQAPCADWRTAPTTCPVGLAGCGKSSIART